MSIRVRATPFGRWFTDDVRKNVKTPNEQIDVWEITPHLHEDYDIAIYDNPQRVIEYFRDLAEEALDTLGHGEQMTITIKHTTMSRHEYDRCCGDERQR